jgi:hypothetical protein
VSTYAPRRAVHKRWTLGPYEEDEDEDSGTPPLDAGLTAEMKSEEQCSAHGNASLSRRAVTVMPIQRNRAADLGDDEEEHSASCNEEEDDEWDLEFWKEVLLEAGVDWCGDSGEVLEFLDSQVAEKSNGFWNEAVEEAMERIARVQGDPECRRPEIRVAAVLRDCFENACWTGKEARFAAFVSRVLKSGSETEQEQGWTELEEVESQWRDTLDEVSELELELEALREKQERLEEKIGELRGQECEEEDCQEEEI